MPAANSRQPVLKLEKADPDTIRVKGEMCFDTVARPIGHFETLLQDIAEPVITLKAVTRADSAGVALLIEWQRIARRHQQTLVFADVPTQILALARVSGVDELLSLNTSQ